MQGVPGSVSLHGPHILWSGSSGVYFYGHRFLYHERAAAWEKLSWSPDLMCCISAVAIHQRDTAQKFPDTVVHHDVAVLYQVVFSLRNHLHQSTHIGLTLKQRA